jgi:hypothetical protein
MPVSSNAVGLGRITAGRRSCGVCLHRAASAVAWRRCHLICHWQARFDKTCVRTPPGPGWLVRVRRPCRVSDPLFCALFARVCACQLVVLRAGRARKSWRCRGQAACLPVTSDNQMGAAVHRCRIVFSCPFGDGELSLGCGCRCHGRGHGAPGGGGLSGSAAMSGPGKAPRCRGRTAVLALPGVGAVITAARTGRDGAGLPLRWPDFSGPGGPPRPGPRAAGLAAEQVSAS